LFRTCLRSPSWDLRRHLTTGLLAITQDADRQRLPLGRRRRLQPSCNNAARVIRAAPSELVSGRPLGTFEDDSDDGLVGDNAKRRLAAAAKVRPRPRLIILAQPRCVLIAPHSSSRSSTRWWGRLRSAGPAAPPPMNPTPARHLPPATLGWQAPGDLAVPPSLRNHGGGGGVGNKLTSSRWRSRLRSAGHSAPPPADGQEPAAFDTGVAGPRRSTFSLGGLVYVGEAEVATTAVAATAAEPPALRRRHCEAAAVSFSRQSALD